VTINEHSAEIICTAFGNGSTHDFQVFKASRMILAENIECLADRGYQGLDKVHANSRTPTKKSKHHPLTLEQKAANRELARRRILAEHVIRKLKIFRILSERYRNRRKRFKLRFNLIAAIYNMELETDVP
jgi:IS5 family transposase